MSPRGVTALQAVFAGLTLLVFGFTVVNTLDVRSASRQNAKQIAVLKDVTQEQKAARRLRTQLVDQLLNQTRRSNLLICQEVNGVKFRIRSIIRVNDDVIDELQIPGFGPKEKREAHERNRKALVALSPKNCSKLTTPRG